MEFVDFKDQLTPIIRQSRTANKVKYDFHGITYQLIVVRRDANGPFHFPKRERVEIRENPLLVVWETDHATHYNWYPCLHGAVHRQTKTWDDQNFNCAALFVDPYYIKSFDKFSNEQAKSILTGEYYKEHNRFIDIFNDDKRIFKTYRDKYDGKKYDDIVFDFKWYFYIKEKDREQFWRVLDERLKTTCDIVSSEGGWCRVYCENNGYRGHGAKDNATRIKESIEGKVNIYEADLDQATRYVIDEHVEVETNLRLLYYDIETDDTNRGIVVGRDQILSIGAEDNFGNSFWKASKDEEELLRWWIKLVKDYDVIIGFNSYNFDGEYITKRCQDQFNIFWAPNYKNVRVGHIDLMRRIIGTFGRHTYIGSFSLDNLSRLFLKKGKVQFEGKIIDLFNQKGRQKLKEYNMGDVELTKELDEALGISKLMIAMCELTGVFPTAFRATENVSGMSVSQLLDTFIMRRAKQENIHYPTATWEKNSNERYAGGLVMEPDPGLYKDVYIFDFKSLYPTIIWSWRISPENLKISTGFQTKEETITSALNPKIQFYKNRTAIFPLLVRELMDARKKYKNLMNAYKPDDVEYKKFNIMQNVTKELTNALYGQLGQQGNRYYSVEKAGSITAAGRVLILRTKELLEEWGYKVFYGDSVTSDRRLVVRDTRDGLIKNMTIAEVFDASARRSLDGDKQFKYHCPFETIVYGDGEISFGKIDYVVRHSVEKKIFRVWNNKGITQVTEDHSFIDSECKKLKYDELKDLFSVKRGYRVPQQDTIHEIDLFEYVKDVDVLEFGKVKTNLVCDDEWIYFKVCPAHKKYKYERGLTPKFKRWLRTEDELSSMCRLIGAYASEGSSSTAHTTTRHMFSLSNDDTNWLKHLRDDIEALTDDVSLTFIKSSDSDNTWKLSSGTKLMSYIFKALCGQTSRGKKLPAFVFNIHDVYKMLVIETLVFGDGHIPTDVNYTDDYKSKNFLYDTASEELANNICTLFFLLGQCYSVRYRKDKQVYRLVTSSKNRDKPVNYEEIDYDGYVYDLNVPDYHNFFDSMGMIGLHNTDSVFVTGLENTTPHELVNRINASLRTWVKEKYNIDDSIIEIEYEKKFGKFIIVGGKNYAGLLTELDGKISDSIKHRGLECVKRNTIKIAKRKQEEMLEDLLRTDYPSHYYIMWLERLKKEFFTHEPNLDDITILTTLTKDPAFYANKTPHVRIAEKMIADQAEFYVGMQIPYVVIDQKLKKEVHIDEYVGGFDKAYYWERIFRPIERILKVAFPEVDWEARFIDKVVKKRKPSSKKSTKKATKPKGGRFIIKATKDNNLFGDKNGISKS